MSFKHPHPTIERNLMKIARKSQRKPRVAFTNIADIIKLVYLLF